MGVSVKKQVPGKPVYKEANEKVGNVQDLAVMPNKAASFAVVGTGRFIGVGCHDVAIPVNRLRYDPGKITLPGAPENTIKTMPKVRHERQEKPGSARRNVGNFTAGSRVRCVGIG